MKKIIFVLVLLSLTVSQNFAQVINKSYFSNDNIIDENYNTELSNWTGNNHELTLIITNYTSIWQEQMKKELIRLMETMDEVEANELYQNHVKWEESINQFYRFIGSQVDLNLAGQMPNQEFRVSLMEKYRDL